VAYSFTSKIYPFHLLFFKLARTGQDATEAFEDVGHSDEARALLPGMFIGDFEVKEVSTLSLFYMSLSYLHRHIYLLSTPGHQTQVSSCGIPVSPCRKCRRSTRFKVSVSHPCTTGADFYLIPRSMMYFLPLAFFGAYFAYRFYSTGSV
jgi:hypothetical protein